MREWLGQTAARILAEKPRRVLEIGCGTGLILSQVAPHCELYVGRDLSARALDAAGRLVAQSPTIRERVRLEQATADEFQPGDEGFYDAVILNSVVQYFPDIGYLAKVLNQALEAVSPGGFVFVGDVRSLPLLPAFHAMLAANRLDGEVSLAQWKASVAAGIRNETELVVHPAFFSSRWLSPLADTRVLLKRGRYHHELTRFPLRCAVVPGWKPVLSSAAAVVGLARRPLAWCPLEPTAHGGHVDG